jgi:glutaredoxin
MVRVFSTAVCPKCKRLKAFLENKGIAFESMNMDTAEGMTELFMLGIVAFEAPVLVSGNNKAMYAKDLFNGTEIQEEAVLGFIA